MLSDTYNLNGGLERIRKASIKHSKFIYNETKRPKRSSLVANT